MALRPPGLPFGYRYVVGRGWLSPAAYAASLKQRPNSSVMASGRGKPARVTGNSGVSVASGASPSPRPTHSSRPSTSPSPDARLRIWDSKADPIAGPAGGANSGLHRTVSGRIVNSAGFYTTDSAPTAADPRPNDRPGAAGTRVRQQQAQPARKVVVDHNHERTPPAAQTTPPAPASRHDEKTHPLAPGKPGVTKPGRTLAGNGPTAPPLDFGGLGNPNVGSMLNPGLADNGAQFIDPSYADSVAGLQYDQQIQGTKVEQARQVRDAAQHLADIKGWYGQVQQSMGTAKTRDQQASTRATGDIGAATQAILSSLGGSANGGAGMVAGQGADNAGLQGALGTAEQQYLGDLGPLLTAEGGSQMVDESHRQTKIAQDLAQQLMDLQGQRGQAKSNAMMGITQQNNAIRDQRLQNLLGIYGQNNQLSQQRFSNRLSAKEAAEAAAMTGAQVKYYGASSHPTGFTSWLHLDPSQKQDLVSAGVGNTVDATGALLGDPNAAKNTVMQYLLGQGYTSAGSAVHNPAHAQMWGLINAAISHAQALGAQKAAAAKAAGQ